MDYINIRWILIAATVLTVVALLIFMNLPQFAASGGSSSNADSGRDASRRTDAMGEVKPPAKGLSTDEQSPPQSSEPFFGVGSKTWLSPPDSAAELFERAALEHRWKRAQILANYQLWSEACGAVRQVASSPTSDNMESYISYEMREGFSTLSAFCGSLDSEADLLALERLEEILDRDAGPKLKRDSGSQDLDDTLDLQPTKESALRFALEQLVSSIRAFDEAGVGSVLWQIANRRLLDSPDLESAEFWHASLRVSQDVAVTLICNEFGGCRGAEHPLVLRYCANKFRTEGLICNLPYSLQEAIFQTSPPVIYDWYLRFYSAIRSELARL